MGAPHAEDTSKSQVGETAAASRSLGWFPERCVWSTRSRNGAGGSTACTRVSNMRTSSSHPGPRRDRAGHRRRSPEEESRSQVDTRAEGERRRHELRFQAVHGEPILERATEILVMYRTRFPGQPAGVPTATSLMPLSV